jgi:hypothetical protein
MIVATVHNGSSNGSRLEPMLRKLEYWQEFSREDREAVLALPHTAKRLEAHNYIVREFDRAEYSCVLLSGFAIRHKIVSGGQRQIVAIHMKGEMVDLQNSLLGRADHSVQMLTAGTIATVPRDEMKRLAFERPAIGQAMWLDTLVDASIFREWVANVGRPRCAQSAGAPSLRILFKAEGCGSWRADQLRTADDSGAACGCNRPYSSAR